MDCADCGHGNRADARFCSRCGTAIEARCGSCLAVLDDGAHFCSACGRPVRETQGTDLSTFTTRDLERIEDRINTVPRRALDWATAAEVYGRAVAMTT